MTSNAETDAVDGDVFDLTRFLHGRSTAWGVFEQSIAIRRAARLA